MVGQNLMEEIDCGTFFDLVDFPSEDIESGLTQTDRESFPTIWSTQSVSVTDGSGSNSNSVFSNNNTNSDLSAELSVPYEDIVQLEWLSNFVEDSFSGENLTMNKEISSKDSSYNQHQFHSCSPVSVLESSSSSSGEKTAPQMFTSGRCGRARSKRPRPTTFHPRSAIQFISQASSFADTKPSNFSSKVSSDVENHAESRFCFKTPKAGNGEQAKKKKTKLTIPLAPVDANQTAPSHSVRKCMHCEITKTPQWRAGPMGPKTLCNACGVRYKSGRLFPEYRPAASPTFVPSIHSNSHRKVLEMRGKASEKVAEADAINADHSCRFGP